METVITKSQMKKADEQYYISTKCLNCEDTTGSFIPKGVMIKNHPCKKCGCVGVLVKK